jgi:hypothetical protein
MPDTMSISSSGEGGAEPITTPRGPLDPPEGVAWFKVLRRNEPANSWETCTIYDDASRAHNGRHTLPDEGIGEFILDHWGSGRYFCAWFSSENKGRGRGKEITLDDPRRPQRPIACGGPRVALPSSVPVAASAATTAPAPDVAQLLALLAANPQILQLVGGAPAAPQQSQLELARLERERERERREWEERRERERREWEEERTRARAADERRAERERVYEEDRRRREEEEHRRRLQEERRRYEEELAALRENAGGVDEEQFREMFEELRDQLRAEMKQKEESLMGKLLDIVKNVAPAFLPQIIAAMPNGARPPLPPAPMPAAPRPQ